MAINVIINKMINVYITFTMVSSFARLCMLRTHFYAIERISNTALTANDLHASGRMKISSYLW